MYDSIPPKLTDLVQPGLPGTSTIVPDDLLARLVTATEAIRDHLAAKVVLDDTNIQAQSVIENDLHPHQEEPDLDPESSAVATSHDEEEPDGWLSANEIRVYTKVCTRHKLKCKMTRQSLRCLQAHLSFSGGNTVIGSKAQQVADNILTPMERLQSSLTEGRAEMMFGVFRSFSELDELVGGFRDKLNPGYNRLFLQVGQWKTVLSSGWSRMYHLVEGRKYTRCLKYIIDTLLPELEAAMDTVCDELAAFQTQSAGDWLQWILYEDLWWHCMGYVEKVFNTSGIDFTEPLSTWPEPEKIRQWKSIYPRHKLVWDKMCDEIGHLIGHYVVVGGDNTVIEAAKSVQRGLSNPINRLRGLLDSSQGEIQAEMDQMMTDLGCLWVSVVVFKRSLYHQKHAFYFREVKQWVDCLWAGLLKLRAFVHNNEPDACLDYICGDLFPKLEKIMLGVTESSKRTEEPSGYSEKEDVGNVGLELKTFGERALPVFLANEMERIRTEKVNDMERDTTRFVNITTIATFFSSVTATTLQFTYQSLGNETSEPLRGVVNLFWFVSLVFSVSSGVSSLLGLTWRKSSIYDPYKPPMLIRLWFDIAPMVFLIFAAVAFVIGLNLFAYLSVQHRYVSFATNVFTGLHGICLIGVTAWFIYQLKHESLWARWIRTLMEWVGVGGLGIWKWAGNLWKWAGDTCRSTWMWVLHLKQEYKDKKLHFKRNVYWAFGFDSRVAQITIDIGEENWERDWRRPYVLSRIVRFIAHPIKKICVGSTKAVSSIILFVKGSIYALFHMGNAGLNPDVESGEMEIANEEKPRSQEDVVEDPVMKAANAYCAMLRELFHEDRLETEIMRDIRIWRNGREQDAEKYITREIWGYPDLVRRFYEEVRPVLVAARDKAREEKRPERESDIDSSDEETEECASEAGDSEYFSEASEQYVGDDKGKGPALEPEDVAPSDSQQSAPENHYQTTMTTTRYEDPEQSSSAETNGSAAGANGVEAERSEQGDVQSPAGASSEDNANGHSSGPSQLIGEAEKEPRSRLW